MNKTKKIVLVVVAVLVTILLIFLGYKKTTAPTIETPQAVQKTTTPKTAPQAIQNKLPELPADNKQAIDRELQGIDKTLQEADSTLSADMADDELGL